MEGNGAYKRLEQDIYENGIHYFFTPDTTARFAERINMQGVPKPEEMTGEAEQIRFHKALINYLDRIIPPEHKEIRAEEGSTLHKVAQIILMLGGYNGMVPYRNNDTERYFSVLSGVPGRGNGDDIMKIIEKNKMRDLAGIALSNLDNNNHK